jgi:hypothetical protein
LGGLLADLLEGARRRNLAANSLAAYERTWRAFLAWAAAASLKPRALSFPTALEAYTFLGCHFVRMPDRLCAVVLFYGVLPC